MTGHRAEPDIRVGLIGFGYAARTFHVPLLRAVPGFRVSAVASTRAAEARAALPGVAVVAEYGALAADPDLDLVVVATPNVTHAPLAEATLRAGRHVVVDKPLSVTAEEARDLASVARQQDRLLSVFHNRRWDSDFITVREVIRGGDLGDGVLFESRFARFRPEVRDRWRESSAPGSGVLYDLGPHLIDQALLLFGVPDTVQAILATQRSGGQSVDYAQVGLRYGARTVVTLRAGMLVAGGSARFVVHGERASLVKHRADVQEEQVRAGILPGAPEWGVDPDDAVLVEGGTGSSRTVKAARGDQRGYYAALREALHGRAPNPVTPAQGAGVMAIIEAAMRSDAEGRRVAPDLRDEERVAW